MVKAPLNIVPCSLHRGFEPTALENKKVNFAVSDMAPNQNQGVLSPLFAWSANTSK